MWHVINADLRLDEIEKKSLRAKRSEKPSQESVKFKLVLKDEEYSIVKENFNRSNSTSDNEGRNMQ